MATTPDLPKTAAKPVAAIADAVTAAPKAIVAAVEAAPAAVAAAVESVANAAPKAKRAYTRRAPLKTAAPVAVKAKRVAKAASKPKTITAAKAVATPKGKTMTDSITDKGEQMIADMKTRAEATVAKTKQVAAELTDFNKGNVEALVESGKIAAKGFEKLGQDAADYGRKSVEQATVAFKTMAAVKSPTELMKLQGDYVRTSFDMMVAETSRSTEAMLKLVGEIAQPISNRFAVAAEKVKLAA